MRDLPRGTVTFLFTDVEGSTRLLKQLRDGYGDVLAEHQRILRKAFEDARGREIDTQGDSFFVAFTRAKDAVDAAVAGQRALASHRWPDGAAVRVRMGLHTGEPVVGDDRYVGLGVHKAARIGAAAHGGQVLLSNATRELVEDELPDGVRLVDLGEHQLKDIDRPERVFQVTARGLGGRFPPLRAEALPADHAPIPPGRRRAAVAAAALSLAGLAAGLALAFSHGGDDPRTPGGSPTSRVTSPGQDPDTIVPGKSIGAIELGMSEDEVRARYGEGTRGQWLSRGRNGARLVFSGPGGALTASFYDGAVVQIATSSRYYATTNGIRVGSVVPQARGLREGVDAWRGFVYEGHQSWCLRGERAATQLIQGTISEHVSTIFITDGRFLAYLPAHVDPNPYTGGEDFFCASKPLEP